MKEPDKIVMQNPGSIRTGKEQMLRGGQSDPRNKALMKMLNMISIGERAGSGVPNIFAVWEDKGWTEPTVEETYGPDRTTLTLEFKTGVNDANGDANDANNDAKTNPIHRKILELIRNNPRITQPEIALEIGVSRATIQRTMKAMVKEKLITRIGSTRGYWHIEK